MTAYAPGPPPYGPNPGFAPANNPAMQLKTSTRAGKVLTFIGIALAVITIALIVWGVDSIRAASREVSNMTYAEPMTGYTAFDLNAETRYLLVAQNYYSDWSSSSDDWSRTRSTDVDRQQLEVIGPDGTAVPLREPDFDFSNVFFAGFFDGLFEAATSDSASFTTTTAGDYVVLPLTELDEDVYFSLIDQDIFSRVVDRAGDIFIAFVLASVVGFFAFGFLLWGIILWSVRASRARRLANPGPGFPPPGSYPVGQPQPGGYATGQVPPGSHTAGPPYGHN